MNKCDDSFAPWKICQGKQDWVVILHAAVLTTMEKSTGSIKSHHGNNSVKEEKQGLNTSDLETIMAQEPAHSSYGKC